MKKLLRVLLFAALFASSSVFAVHAPTLAISAGSLTTIVNDGSSIDANQSSGAVTFDGAVGSWIIAASGIASPPPDSLIPGFPNAVNAGLPTFWDFYVSAGYTGEALSSADKQLSIRLSVNDFGAGLYYFLSLGNWNMTSIDSSNWATNWIWYVDDTPIQMWNIGPGDFGNKGYYASSAWYEAANPVAISQEFKTTATASDSTVSFNFRIWGANTSFSIPEPSSALLMLAAGLGLLESMRRRKSA